MGFELNNWLNEKDYKKVQQSVPIATIDILPISYIVEKKRIPESIGLIRRETADEGIKWCVIGGRLLYGESFWSGVLRQIRETLGGEVRILSEIKDQQPLFVAQYFPDGNPPFLRDPRQHTVGLTYALELNGKVIPQGEALEFKWFHMTDLPINTDFGFNHDRLVRSLIQRLNKRN